jgi:bifunctional non-homologous end joining protein LigD
MMLWDLGVWEPLGDSAAQLAKGDFKFRLHGRKLRGEFALVRLKNSTKNEWLLLKKKDAAARVGFDLDELAWSVKTGRRQDEIAHDLPPRPGYLEAAGGGGSADPMPESIQPMLASLSKDPPAGPAWVYEVKWDGVRALAYVRDGALRITGRKGTEIGRQYPELAALPQWLAAQTAVVDGEIAAVDENGRPRFERLQPRIMASDPGAIAQLARSRPATYFAFDLLYLDGQDLRGRPLEDRKRLLQGIVKPGGPVKYSDHFAGPLEPLLAAVRAQGLEGLMAKRLDSQYEATRSRDWVKIKVNQEQEFLLCGYLPGERDYFGALILGVHDQGELHWAGNVGTGFDAKAMRAIREVLDPLVTTQPPFPKPQPLLKGAVWARPELAATVRYLEWTGEGRLRGPVFVKLRPDVDPADCTRVPAEAIPPRAELLVGKAESAKVTVEGHPIPIKNLNKVFYPAEGYTKRDVINYYAAVAELILPHLADRPLSLRRYPDGIAAEGFFQKNTAEGFPEWVRTETILAENGQERRQVIGGRRADLIYLANLGCIDQNPWMSRVATLDHPDFILIDLDPQDCPYARIVEAALTIRRKLDQLELTGYPKTTGGKGMHIYVPLEPIYSYEQSRSIAEILARLAAVERPDLFTMPRSVQKRDPNRVYFDWMQNARGKTISAPYVLRAHPGAPVATPLDWRELTPGLDPKQFHIRNALDRFDRAGDLFAGVLRRRQRLDGAIGKLEQLIPS